MKRSSEPTPEALLQTARSWAAQDPDPQTRAEAEALIDAADPDALRDHYGHRLQFGTAGIRGAMGPGPGRMNRVLVRQVALGLGRYVKREVEGAVHRGVAVGYDGRHNSKVFAEDVARTLGGLGLRVYLFEDVVPTPILAHALTFLGCAAGAMITASHNPPADNGFKVYWENGAQIIPPHDRGISAEIDSLDPGDAAELPPLGQLRSDEVVRPVPPAAWDNYERRVLALRVHNETGAQAVYTAMHGVGHGPLVRILGGAGHAPPLSVIEQQEPDGDFPTVAFPNPEEPGALDLAMKLATAQGADLILANDPDADRLAVAIPDGRGGWRRLSGNEVGVLLADDLLEHRDFTNPMVATTVVSTSMLGRIAADHGATLVETLTGFKWIANAALAHDGDFVIGFEEALGYSAGAVVRDKDGISTALLFLDLASTCKAQGTTIARRLERLYRRHGYVASAQRSVRLPGLDGADRMRAVMAGLREHPPEAVAGLAVRRTRDILTGRMRVMATGETRPIDLPRSNVLAFDLEHGCRALVRPSGTEPKLKFYFEVTEALADDEAVPAARRRAEARIEALADDLLARAGLG